MPDAILLYGPRMKDIITPDPATADLLDGAAMALAAYAAERLLGVAAPDTTPSGPFRWWQSYLSSRLRDLAAAVHLGRPELFHRQLAWCRDALSAKDVDGQRFLDAMRALADVIENELPGVGSAIADTYIRAGISDLPPMPSGEAAGLDTTHKNGRLTAEYVLAVLEGDRRRAAALIRGAVEQGRSIRELYLDVLVPASREIGLMWHRDEISIAEEHFATSTTQMVMGQLIAGAPIAEANGKTVVISTVAGDRHGLGPQLVADFFEMDGWRVIYLGPDIPGDELPGALMDFDADLLLLSATLFTHLRSLERSVQVVHRAMIGRPVPVIVGGAAFNGVGGLAEQVGADGYARDAEEAVAMGRALVGLPESQA